MIKRLLYNVQVWLVDRMLDISGDNEDEVFARIASYLGSRIEQYEDDNVPELLQLKRPPL